MNTIDDLERDLKELEQQEKNIKQKVFKTNRTVFKTLKKRLDKYDANFQFLPIRYKQNNLLQISINKNRYKTPKGYTRDKIKTISKDVSEFLKKNNISGKIIASIQYDKGFRSGYLTDIGNDPVLYDPDDYVNDIVDKKQSNFDAFVIYVVEQPAPRGGTDNYNDCLYHALQVALLEDNPFKDPYQLKKYLKLKRSDKVPLSCIEKVEQKIKNNIGINVSGDYIYHTKKKTNKIINLILSNEHYKLDHNICRKVFNVEYKEKKPLIYNCKTFEVYDGIKKWKLTKQERDDIYDHKTDYILVNMDDFNSEMEDEYEEFIRVADTLKKETNNIINLYKTGENKRTALNLFDMFTKYIKTPDEIKQDEAIFINNASIGAIIHTEAYEGEGYKYDVVSMYPSILNGMLLTPLERGEFIRLSQDEFNNMQFYKYGVYRCIINKSDDINVNKLFRFNNNNHYTHISLTHARKLGLKIELIIDDEPNFLYYSRDKLITCHELFGKYIDFMFDLKQKKLPRSKMILNILWGALCQKNTVSKCIDNDSTEIIDLPDDIDFDNIKPLDDKKTKTIIDYVNRQTYYKSNFARLAPFLLSKGRLMISDILQPHKEHIKRIHTDGFISSSNLDIKTGQKLGELKYEGHCPNVKIVNNANIEGDFKL